MANFATDGKICLERELEVETIPQIFNDLVPRFDINETCKWICDNDYKKVCLQFPDDLLSVSVKIYEEIKQRVDMDLYILGDTSYANCCIDSVAAMHVQADAVVHYGHTCFTKTNIPVYIILPKKNIDADKVIEIISNHFQDKENVNFCLFYDQAFEYCKDQLSTRWFHEYPQSYIAFVEKDDTQQRFSGRIVRNKAGEELPIETVKDCLCVYIGSSEQTVFNYAISIPALDWCHIDPDKNQIEHMENTMWFRRRRFLVEKCKDANVIGILVCKLAGDQTKEIIKRMKQLCKVNGKKSYIVSVGKPNVAKLANFPEIDIYVMIACPENNLYSSRDFYKPIVYPFELEVALNSNREPYYTNQVTDYDELLPGRRYYCEIGHVAESTDVSLITGKIRETKVETEEGSTMDLAEKQNWALESIGQNLQDKSWKGLEQKLGQTEVKTAEEGRKGIPLQYINEPKE